MGHLKSLNGWPPIMRILLDESMPRPLAKELAGHQVSTVVQCGWGGITNGALLALAAGCFDVFITGDQNLRYQQNLTKLPITVVVLATGNDMKSLRPIIPRLLAQLPTLPPRTLMELHP